MLRLLVCYHTALILEPMISLSLTTLAIFLLTSSLLYWADKFLRVRWMIEQDGNLTCEV
jgi:hypothetical protein